MIDTIIFDMDGVIIDSEPVLYKLERELFHDLGIEVSAREHDTFVGVPDDEMLGSLRKTRGLTQTLAELSAMSRGRYAQYIESNGEMPLVPGVADLIGRLRDYGYALAVASSSPMRSIVRVVEHYGFSSSFRVLASAEEVARGKPSPDVFLHAASKMQANPATCLVIEDSHNGLRAALAAGMRCIGYKNCHSQGQDLTIADVTVDSMESVTRELIASLVKGG